MAGESIGEVRGQEGGAQIMWGLGDTTQALSQVRSHGRF